jgi:peptidyl-prolyl cis-trans isomerase C
MRALPAAACVVAGVLWVRGDIRAADAGTPREQVVATVGGPQASRTVTAGELEDRLASMPGFQRATFGSTPEGIRHAVLDRVLVREALASLGAEADGVALRPSVAFAVNRALARAAVRAMADAVPPVSAIPMADVRAYYDAHHDRYDVPARYALWRILCKTKDDAAEVLAAAQADPTPKAWAQLARDRSEDKATAMRSGDLGFLTLEGEGREPGLKVDPAIVKAAQAVKDGELVKAPVPEGEYFAVVWRRGTLPADKRTVDEAAPAIREMLRQQQVKDATDKRIAELRAAKVRDVNEDPVERLDLPEGDASRSP